MSSPRSEERAPLLSQRSDSFPVSPSTSADPAVNGQLPGRVHPVTHKIKMDVGRACFMS